MKLDKIKYLPHPVDPEEKVKLNRQGYKVLDARFEPKAEKPKAKSKAAK